MYLWSVVLDFYCSEEVKSVVQTMNYTNYNRHEFYYILVFEVRTLRFIVKSVSYLVPAHRLCSSMKG